MTRDSDIFPVAVLLAIALALGTGPLSYGQDEGVDAATQAADIEVVGFFVTAGASRALLSVPWADAPGGRRDVLVGEGDLVAGFTVRSVEADRAVLALADREYPLQMKGTRRLRPDLGIKVYSTAYKGSNEYHPHSDRLRAHHVAADARREMLLSSAARPEFRRPMPGWISSPFGLRRRPRGNERGGWVGSRNHPGVDIAAPFGTRVQAAADGRVVESGYSYHKGNYVVLQHSGGYSTRYYHLSRRYVKSGDYVKSGQRIGTEGSTGNSTGPHLHFEIRKNDEPLDPALFIPSLKKR